MKKSLFALLALTTLFCIACQNNVEVENGKIYKTPIAQNIAIMKENGLFDSLLNARSVVTDEETLQMIHFIENTDEILEEIKSEENGEEQIKVIEALFNNGSSDDFSNALAFFDEEKAFEFSKQANDLAISSETQMRNTKTINDIAKIAYYNPNNTNARAIFSDNLTWTSIGIYTGFCTATIAGFMAASCGPFWVRIVGRIALTAGVASMGKQLYKWCDSTELASFISSLCSTNLAGIESALESSNGSKIICVSVETVATILVCSLTPFGYDTVQLIVSYYNQFMGKILDILPKNIHYKLWGIDIEKKEIEFLWDLFI